MISAAISFPGTSRLLAIIMIASLCTGCLSEQSFPVRPGDVRRLSDTASSNEPRDTRSWLRETHRQLKDFLPRDAQSKAMLTEDLTKPDGKPIDVLDRFGLKGQTLDSIFTNCAGLQHTAQASGGDHPSTDGPPIWPGFDDVWVPINERLSLAGRFGLARRDGVVRYLP